MSQIEVSIDKIGRTRDEIGRTRLAAQSQREQQGKRVGISTLGCKVNTFESELIAETLKTSDWSVVPSDQEADLYLINTCTVTREADRQARQSVRRVVKRNPDALVVVTGCYAQMDAAACAAIPGVDLVLGNDQKLDVHKLLPALQRGELPQVMVGDLDQHVSLPSALLTGFEAQTRAFVQIQQGCDQGCTFCIIHTARGPSRSLAPSLIIRQVQRLVMNGYPEIVICGVDVGSYGDDLTDQDVNLVTLLRALLKVQCDSQNPVRIRLSSIDPYHISDELIDLIETEQRICNQFHLSLQSGNSLILKRMKRRYSAEHVRERIMTLRARVPNFVLSADVMVGFPTESEEQYLDTENMVRELDIAYPHVFSYSERNGTPAARIPVDRQVPLAERKSRNQQMRSVGAELENALLARKVGGQGWVLPERVSSRAGYAVCRGEDYVPVLVPVGTVKMGRWLECEFTQLTDNWLYGRRVN